MVDAGGGARDVTTGGPRHSRPDRQALSGHLPTTRCAPCSGASLFTLKHDPWLPRRRALQPVFTKQNVRAFGGHITQAADVVAASWSDGQQVDLDAECRRLTLRALGRSVLGIDLDERADAIAEPLRTALGYVTARITSLVKPPRWLPTPARRRARAAAATLRRLAAEVLQACRDDPTHDAPLVRAMIAATDPETGRPLTDDEIRNELIVFMSAGHDTTATTLTYALWALGRHPDMQSKVRAETDAVGDEELTPDDVPRLRYTVQVLHEALRLCPPAPSIPRLITHDIEVDGYLVKAGTLCTVGVYAMHRDPDLWERPAASSTPIGSARKMPRAATAGNTSRSAQAPAPASATTSPCSRPPSRWPPSSGAPKSVLSVRISRSLCPSRWSPRALFARR